MLSPVSYVSGTGEPLVTECKVTSLSLVFGYSTIQSTTLQGCSYYFHCLSVYTTHTHTHEWIPVVVGETSSLSTCLWTSFTRNTRRRPSHVSGIPASYTDSLRLLRSLRLTLDCSSSSSLVSSRSSHPSRNLLSLSLNQIRRHATPRRPPKLVWTTSRLTVLN